MCSFACQTPKTAPTGSCASTMRPASKTSIGSIRSVPPASVHALGGRVDVVARDVGRPVRRHAFAARRRRARGGDVLAVLREHHVAAGLGTRVALGLPAEEVAVEGDGAVEIGARHVRPAGRAGGVLGEHGHGGGLLPSRSIVETRRTLVGLDAVGHQDRVDDTRRRDGSGRAGRPRARSRTSRRAGSRPRSRERRAARACGCRPRAPTRRPGRAARGRCRGGDASRRPSGRGRRRGCWPGGCPGRARGGRRCWSPSSATKTAACG